MFKILKKDKISENEVIQIKEIWRKNFCEDSNENDIGLLEETMIGMLVKEKKIIAIVFLINLTEKLLNSNDKYFTNIKEQGVTQNDFYLYNFVVIEEERKKGYGKLLLEESEKYVRSLNKNKILLFVKNGNIPAIIMYNKFNYKVQRATPNGFIMEKNM